MNESRDRLAAALTDRYRIERELGQGGMATVYLAEDLRHHRKVAIKVLKPDLAAVLGAERFVQEITTTAQLSHPHILPLFDSGEDGGFLYYVMPYIEGETIRTRLNRETQLGVEEAVRIATEVADALDYAHRHGVIHRDIKPENILLHDGRAMVMDFGIALAVSAAAGGRMTETGLSLGTPHYMSPEQATADREITGRSDIYSLASVLYEMLSGEPPHMGTSAQQIIMKIIAEPVKPVTDLRKSVPPNVAAAVSKALEKLPADRFTSARAFADALANPSYTVAARPGEAGVRAGAAGWRARLRDPFLLALLGITTAAIAVALATSRSKSGTGPTVPPIRFVVPTSDSIKVVGRWPWPAAISPAGEAVVYACLKPDGTTMLCVLRTDRLQPEVIPGTAEPSQMHFSPDGQWLAFEQNDTQRRVRLDGSQPVTITGGSGSNGAAWTIDGEIVLGAHQSFSGLSRVSVAGGKVVALTQVDSARVESSHLWPIALPGGKLVAFAIWTGNLNSCRLALASLDDGVVTPLGLAGIRPLALLDGMLVYLQADGVIMAVPLDTDRKRVGGTPIAVHDPVPVEQDNNGNSGIYISQGGALVSAANWAGTRLTWLDQDGRPTPFATLPQGVALSAPRLSPDGRRIALVVAVGRQQDAWAYDLERKSFSKLTTLGGVTSVDWTADGASVVFTTAGDQSGGAVWSQPASGGTPPTKIFESETLAPDVVMAPDSRALLVGMSSGSQIGIHRVALDTPGVARQYVGSNTFAPQFAPNGKWVVMMSYETGVSEVYVRSFPDPGEKFQISTGGGRVPRWSGDGSRIYYWMGPTLVAARVTTSTTFALQGLDTVRKSDVGYDYYDVAPDGSAVLVVTGERPFELVVSPNWITEFRRRVAESRAER